MDTVPSLVSLVAPLRTRLAACQEQFALHFAGQPRLTRDVVMLDCLVEELRDIVAAAAPGEEEATAEVAKDLIDTYLQERDHIAGEQEAAGPHGRAMARLHRRAGFIAHRYVRHFAGQHRQSRSLGLLQETRACLRALAASLRALGPLGADVGPALAWVQREDERLQTEAAAIAALRAVPALDVRAGALASVANTLFETYHRLAVGRPRLAVRPGLLLRLVDELQEVRDGMQAAADEGLDAAHHRDNIADVARQVELWRQEHLAAARLRQGANDGEVAAALNEEVSAVLDAYNAEVAEQAEHAIDLEAVRALCDRMDELEGQMEALRHVPGLEGHAQNLVVVGDALGMLQVTYDAMCARRRTP